MRIRILLFLLFTIPTLAISQVEHNSGLWLGMDVNKDLKRGFDLGAEGNLRFASETSDLSSALVDLSIKKGWNDYLKTSLVYRASARNGDFGYSYRGRWALDNRVSVEKGKFRFQYRLRYQVVPGVLGSELDWRGGGHALRHRLSATWDLPDKWWLTGSYEHFSAPYRDGLLYATDSRIKLVAEKRIKKRKYIYFGYQLDRNMTQTALPTRHVLVMGYQLELKKKKKKDKSEANAERIRSRVNF